MEDLYSVLQCTVDSSQEKIKTSYRQLALKTHPDAHPNEDPSYYHEAFTRLSHAYQILSHPDLRFAYDTRWKERQLLQEFPVEDEMYLEDMEEYDSNYTYPCRCGDEYTLTVTDVRLRYDYAACGSCSLCIRIIYPKNDPVELNQLANTNISDT